MRRFLSFVAPCVLSFVLAGCAGSTSSPPAQISITILPTSASVAVGQTQQFTASVSGTSNTGVTWAVNGTIGGSSTVGMISSNGLYTAPNSPPNPTTVTVTATSTANTSKSASASVTITSAGTGTVTVSPNPATVEVFASQQFTATINGQPSSAVTWQVNAITGGNATAGTISTAGVYHAPNSVPTTSTSGGGNTTAPVTVTAVSQANSSSSGSATVTVFAPNQNTELIPVKLGTTGGNANDSSTSGGTITCCGGTLGSLVSRGGNQYILSVNHVLARTDLATTGENIIQPGLIDANCSTVGTTTVGHLSQSVTLESNKDSQGVFHPVADAAIAQVVPLTVDSAGTILELGGTNSGGMPTDGPPHGGTGVPPVLNHPVAKSGRTTGLTCSGIFSVSTSTSIQYQKGCGTGTTFTATYTNQVAVTGGSFSAEGDSGSLIVTQDSADPVALLYAGSDVDTVGNPVSDVLTALADPTTGVKPVFVGTASTHPVAACSLPGPQAAMTARLAAQKVAPSSGAIAGALRVRDLHAPELMAHPEVQAIGVGASFDHPGEPTILLFVTRDQPRTGIPAVVDGIRTRFIEGELFAQRGVLSAEQSAALEQAAPAPQSVYPISESEFARAKAVHAAHVEEWMSKAGVQGVGIGSSVDSPGEAALVIFLVRGVAHEPIPPVIDGLRTRIRESSRFRTGFGDQGRQRGCSLPPARKVIRCEIQKAIARPKSEAANLSICDRKVADPGPAGAVNWPTLPEARDAHFCTLQALPGVQFPQAAGKDRFSLRPCPREVRMRGAVVFLAVLFVSAVAASSSRQTQTPEKPEEAKIPPEAAKRENPVKPTPQGLAEAKRLYGYDCAFCHGAAGDGKGDVAAEMKLTLKDWRDPAALAGMTDGELFYLIIKGKGKMVGEEGRLNNTQAWQMVNYVRSLVKKNSEEKPKADAPKQ